MTATVLGTAGRLAGEEWDALAGRGFSLHGWHAAAEARGHPLRAGVEQE